MKRITRLIKAGPETGTRVWLDPGGHWTRDISKSREFDDAEAEKRVRRIPHASVESIENESAEG